MCWQPISRQWPGDSAILLVHGIGDASQGYYDDVLQALEAIPEFDISRFAVYPFLYDFILDWMSEKAQYAELASAVAKLQALLGFSFGGDECHFEIAESAGDVISPVLSLDVRNAVKTAYAAQLRQLLADGTSLPGNKKRPLAALNVSIICHSFGCFHTYEALHYAARQSGTRPSTDGLKLANVIYMASPVQLVRSVAKKLGVAVPRPGELALMSGDGLTQPCEPTQRHGDVRLVTNWVSIAGNLDPVGGHLFGKELDWAYMTVDGQVARVWDQLGALDLSQESVLGAVVGAITGCAGAANALGLEDPHSWTGYIRHYGKELKEWLQP